MFPHCINHATCFRPGNQASEGRRETQAEGGENETQGRREEEKGRGEKEKGRREEEEGRGKEEAERAGEKEKEMAKKMKAAATYKDKHKTVNLIVGTPKAKGKEPKAPRLGGGGRGGGGGGRGGYSSAALASQLLAQQYGQQQYAASQAEKEKYKKYLLNLGQQTLDKAVKESGVPFPKYLDDFLKAHNISQAQYGAALRHLFENGQEKVSEAEVIEHLAAALDRPDLPAQFSDAFRLFVETPEGRQYLQQRLDAEAKKTGIHQVIMDEAFIEKRLRDHHFAPESGKELSKLLFHYLHPDVAPSTKQKIRQAMPRHFNKGIQIFRIQ